MTDFHPSVSIYTDRSKRPEENLTAWVRDRIGDSGDPDADDAVAAEIVARLLDEGAATIDWQSGKVLVDPDVYYWG